MEKLENIYQQEYPRDRIEIIIVDSGSTDGTPRESLGVGQEPPGHHSEAYQRARQKGQSIRAQRGP
ncbi:glycosyltransferase [Thermofilum sp.]|uniref:glycosyltransferase n=1 Tax=Thermofilum sp. TaxID=1961369 RepID=UPI00319E0458